MKFSQAIQKLNVNVMYKVVIVGCLALSSDSDGAQCSSYISTFSLTGLVSFTSTVFSTPVKFLLNRMQNRLTAHNYKLHVQIH